MQSTKVIVICICNVYVCFCYRVNLRINYVVTYTHEVWSWALKEIGSIVRIRQREQWSTLQQSGVVDHIERRHQTQTVSRIQLFTLLQFACRQTRNRGTFPNHRGFFQLFSEVLTIFSKNRRGTPPSFLTELANHAPFILPYPPCRAVGPNHFFARNRAKKHENLNFAPRKNIFFLRKQGLCIIYKKFPIQWSIDH